MSPLREPFKARAHIDFITLTLPAPRPAGPGIRKGLERGLEKAYGGTWKLPEKRWEKWVTFHDPQVRGLQRLIDDVPHLLIEKLEIAIDMIPTAENSPRRREQLYRWFRHSAVPKQAGMTKVLRKHYVESTDRYETLRTLAPPDTCSTYLLEDARRYLQSRLYIKVADVPAPVVRFEVTLRRGGVQEAGVDLVGLLPDFVSRLRRFVTPMLSIGCGLRPASRIRIERYRDPIRRAKAIEKLAKAKADRTNRWERYGAACALRDGLSVLPDRAANRKIETALKRLQDRLRRLKKPKKVADYSRWRADALARQELFLAGLPRSYRYRYRYSPTEPLSAKKAGRPKSAGLLSRRGE